LKFPDIRDLAGNTFYVMTTSAANERVSNIDDHVVNSRSANLQEFVSERHTLFQQYSEKKAMKFD